MPAAAVADFVAALQKLPLLTPEQQAKLVSLQKQFPDLKPLAQELIRRGWLTPFQANHLARGRGKELVLDQYVLLDLIGQGGMGSVYKARQLSMDRAVALKVIKREALQAPGAVERFQREARAAARLAHPNVVTVFDSRSAGGVHFLSMEYLEGADLAQLVKAQGTLAVAEACAYVRQAALGLQHAHEQGLVHRDIKPHNLLLTKKGTIKVMDLGLARSVQAADAAATEGLTTPGTVMGTADYIAPEQAMNARNVDIRADIYSLGCTLYHLLAGRVPHTGESLTEKLLKHQLEEPEPLERLRPEVPAAVAAVVRKMMARSPEQRYRTPFEVAQALEACAQAPVAIAVGAGGTELQLPVAVPADTVALSAVATVPGSAGRRSRKRRPLLVAALGAAVVLCGGLAWKLGGSSSKPSAPQVAAAPPSGAGASPSGAGARPTAAASGRTEARPSTPEITAAARAKAEALYNRAEIHYQRGEYDAAVADYTQSLQLNPTDSSTWTGRGNAYHMKREYPKAIADYTRALELSPKDATTLSNRGNSYVDNKDLDRALADYTRAIELDPKYISAFQGRGNVYQEKKDYDKALVEYARAIELDPKDAGAYRGRGHVYYETKDYDKAIAEYTRAIELDPKLGGIFHSRANAHYSKKDYDKAIADYTRSIELDPKHAQSYYYWRGKAHAQKGNTRLADEDLAKALALDPASGK